MAVPANTTRRLEWCGLILILALASALRLGAPGLVEFKQDEANLSLLALNLAHGRDFPLLGIDSSVGIRNAPGNIYILALPYLLSSDPTLATQYIGLLNVIAVLLTYLLARRYYGPLAAFVAGLLYAASPWAVFFSRKIWAQEMLPVFILMTVGTGLIGFLEGKRWAQWIHLPLLVITGQIHYVAFVFIPISLLLIVAGGRRGRLRWAFVFSIGLAALTVVPYAVGIQRAALLSRLFTGEPHPLALTGQAFEYAFQTIGGAELHTLVGPEASPLLSGAYPVFYALALLVLLAAAWLIVRCIRRRGNLIDVALLLWLGFTPLVFTVTWTPVFNHYMIPILPAACLVMGVAAGALWKALARQLTARRAVFAASGVALAGVVGLQILSAVTLLDFVNTHADPGAFGTPLGDYMPVRGAILGAHPAQVLARLDGQFTGYNPEASIWNVLLYDLPLVRFLDQGIEVYPAQGALYFSHECERGGTRFTLRGDCYDISLPPVFETGAYTPAPDSALELRFANSARVIGYRWEPHPDGCLSVVWGADGPASGPNSDFFQVAVHFINDKGEEFLNADAAFWNGRYWRAGDTIVRRFCLQYGQENVDKIVGVRLGLYTTGAGNTFYNVEVQRADGTPVGQQIEIRFR